MTERGVVKVGEELEIVGIRPNKKTTCTGSRCSASSSPTRLVAGDNVGLLLRGIERDGIERGQVDLQARIGQAAHPPEAEAYILTKEEGKVHAVLRQLPAAVLLPHHRRHRHRGAALRHRDGDARRQPEVRGDADLADRHGEKLRFAIREGGRTVGAGVVSKIIE